MKVVLFCHSVLSDWNNGNAHFQRGVISELLARGCAVSVFEPRDAWSVQNLVAEAGPVALWGGQASHPRLEIQRYDLATLDVSAALDGADVVIVHEWNALQVIARIGRHRVRGGRYALFFHDTHHRTVSAPEEMSAYDFSGYDGVLAFGDVLRRRYEAFGWGNRAYTWHEAADTRVFYPKREGTVAGDIVWVGNWGDDERSGELREFLLDPVRALGLRARVHGVRYPSQALSALRTAGVEYSGWLPNHRVPDVFGAFRATVHVPRRPYAETLRGIPTIRVFEALACGIPLISAPWHDTDGLFREGKDYLLAQTGRQMSSLLRNVLLDADMAETLARSGRETVLARHTCRHRVDELLDICDALAIGVPRVAASAALQHAQGVPPVPSVGPSDRRALPSMAGGNP